jgi:outer membrane protein assembly factor BamB
VLALAAALLAAGCEGVLPDWLGEAEEPPLPGERIPIMLLESRLSADPALATTPVRIPPPIPTPNWPQSGGIADHAMHHVAAEGSLAPAWRADVGAGDSDDGRITSAPVAARGVVFAMDAEAGISAFRADNGKRIWRIAAEGEDDEGGFGGGLAYGQGRLFATTGYGEVLALDPRDGGVLWRYRAGPPLRAAPAINRGRVFATTVDNQLLVLDGATGELLWQHRGLEETAGLVGGASPAVSAGVVVAAYSSGELYALKVENGVTAWTDSLLFANQIQSLGAINDINGDPVIDRGRVYAASHGGRLVSIDVRSGAVAWDVELSSVETPWIAGDYLYVVSTDGDVVCLTRVDGRIRWVRVLPRWEDPEDKADPILWTGPILVGDRLIVAGSNGQVVALSPFDGRPLGRLDLGQPIDVPPIAADGTVYLLTRGAELVALR